MILLKISWKSYELLKFSWKLYEFLIDFLQTFGISYYFLIIDCLIKKRLVFRCHCILSQWYENCTKRHLWLLVIKENITLICVVTLDCVRTRVTIEYWHWVPIIFTLLFAMIWNEEPFSVTDDTIFKPLVIVLLYSTKMWCGVTVMDSSFLEWS